MATTKQTPATKVDATTARKATIGANGFKFVKTKVVTVPVLKLMPGAPVYIKVHGKMEKSKQIDSKKVGDKAMEPATIMHCVDLTTGEETLVIVGKMLESVINEGYPSDSYVGKCFEIINHGKRGDKKYNAYSLVEIEVEED